ncbi:MAG: DUF5685 family protein [Clostridia bacterium]
MFGYVVIDKPNILVKDWETYRGYYCGLCKAIGKQTGNMMRFSLNYDIVLLALLGFNYEKVVPEFSKGSCIVHPIRKKLNIVKPNEIMFRISDINTLLGYYKICDDVIDENKHKSIKMMLRPYYKKAKARLPELAKKIDECYTKLRASEVNEADEKILSDIFGQMMIAVAEGLTKNCDEMLRELCFYLGKWVYLIDAVDDLKKDFEEKNYNPFLRGFSKLGDDEFNIIEPKARFLLNDCIDKILATYERINILISEGALSNILYRGLQQRTDLVFSKRGEECRKIRF